MAEPTPDVSGYETDVRLFATRYKQGGRTVYSLVLSPRQVVNLFPIPDPTQTTEGNRRIRTQHARDFARYFRDHPEWVAPGILLRTPEPFDFDVSESIGETNFGYLSFPRRKISDIFISDGQHRILGFAYAEEDIEIELDKAKSAIAGARQAGDVGAETVAKERLALVESWKKRMESERVSVEIYVESNPKKYKQMFFDIADNALGITASVKSRFDSKKVVNRSLEDVFEHPLLRGKVDLELDRVRGDSPFLISARNAAEVVRAALVGLDGRVSKIQERELDEKDVAKNAETFLDLAVESFPELKQVMLGTLAPKDLRKSSLLGSVLVLRALAGVYHDLKNRAWTDEMIEEYFRRLAPHMAAPVTADSVWMTKIRNSPYEEGAVAPRARRQDLKALKDALLYWAVIGDFDLPPLALEDPQAGTLEEVLEADMMSDTQADEVLRPETAAARKKAKALS